MTQKAAPQVASMRGLVAPLRYNFDEWTIATSQTRKISEGFIDSKDLVPWRPSDGLNPDLLRFWTLFWDDICYPTWDDEHVVMPEDQLLLSQEGILQAFQLGEAHTARDPAFSSLQVGEYDEIDYDKVFAWMQIAAFKSLNDLEPGRWSLASEPNLELPKTAQVGGRAWLVSLYNAVPVPAKSIPIEKVLAFRDERRPELLSLRYHLEGVYQRIISAGDGDLALETEKELLGKAIYDYVQVTKEKRFKINWASVEAKLDWEFNPSLAAIAAAGGFLLGGVTSATIAGVGTALMPKIKLSNTTKIEGVEPRPTPFEYVTSINKHLR